MKGGESSLFAKRHLRRRHARDQPVETSYCEGCGHNTFFTNSTMS